MNKNVKFSHLEVFGFYNLFFVTLLSFFTLGTVWHTAFAISGMIEYAVLWTVGTLVCTLIALLIIRFTLFRENGYSNAFYRLTCFLKSN